MHRFITRRAPAVGAPGARRRQRPPIAALAIAACTSIGLALPVAASAGGPNGNGNPSGVAPLPLLPADLPASFPIPPGTLTGSTGSSPRWNVGEFLTADSPAAHQQLVDFYIAHGFHWDRTPFDDSTLHNAAFVVVFVARTADTSSGVGAGTDVALGITQTSNAPTPSTTAPGSTTTPGTTTTPGSTTAHGGGRTTTPSHHRKTRHKHHGARHRVTHSRPGNVKSG